MELWQFKGALFNQDDDFGVKHLFLSYIVEKEKQIGYTFYNIASPKITADGVNYTLLKFLLSLCTGMSTVAVDRSA